MIRDRIYHLSSEIWENLSAIGAVLSEIKLDRIQLNTLDRQGTVQGLRAATHEELNRIAADWGMKHVEIIAPPADRKKKAACRSDLESVILGALEESGRMEAVEQDRGTFYHVRIN